jgi:hypothetical protein
MNPSAVHQAPACVSNTRNSTSVGPTSRWRPPLAVAPPVNSPSSDLAPQNYWDSGTTPKLLNKCWPPPLQMGWSHTRPRGGGERGWGGRLAMSGKQKDRALHAEVALWSAPPPAPRCEGDGGTPILGVPSIISSIETIKFHEVKCSCSNAC